MDEVARELASARDAVGSAADVEAFVRSAVIAHGGVVTESSNGSVTISSTMPAAVRDAVRGETSSRPGSHFPCGPTERCTWHVPIRSSRAWRRS